MDKMTGKGKTQPSAQGGTVAANAWKDITQAAKETARSIDAQTENLNNQNQRMLERIGLEGELAGASKADREARLAGFDAETKRRQEFFRIEQDIAKLESEKKADPNDFAMKGKQQIIDAYERQKKALADIAKQAEDVKRASIEQQNAAEMTAYWNEQQVKAKQMGLDLDYNIADLTKSEFQKQSTNIDRLIQKEGDLAIAKRQAQLGPDGIVSEEEQSKIRARIEKIYGTLREKNADFLKQSRQFSTGWEKAWNDYIDNATNAAEQAKQIVSTMTKGMEDTLFNFFKTGKLDWKNFIQSMIDTLMRSQIQSLIAKTFGGIGGASAPNGGGLLGGALIPGFLASGGQANSGNPYIVGEHGPELFVPNTTGTVVPNEALGGGGSSVTYNINAVDAMSFKQMLAKDPTFLHAVAEQGRRSLPGSR
jgi:lambda family phage tail tape measure protein